MLIVGFTLGQIQLIEPMAKEYSKLFNEEVMLVIMAFVFLCMDLMNCTLIEDYNYSEKSVENAVLTV
jgi:hypothetical protein